MSLGTNCILHLLFSALAQTLHTTFHALPKLPHSRHDTARAQRVDGDGGFKAAIWGGALAARHACVSGCKFERYHITSFPPPLFLLTF